MSGSRQLVAQPMDEDAVASEVLRRVERRDHAELERPHPRDYTAGRAMAIHEADAN
jgi:hypothetical protein